MIGGERGTILVGAGSPARDEPQRHYACGPFFCPRLRAASSILSERSTATTVNPTHSRIHGASSAREPGDTGSRRRGDRAVGVSIRARLTSRAIRHGWSGSAAAWRFNPRPAHEPGDTCFIDADLPVTLVSIRARLTSGAILNCNDGSMMICMFQSAPGSQAGRYVFGRRGSTTTGLFQSAPGSRAGRYPHLRKPLFSKRNLDGLREPHVNGYAAKSGYWTVGNNHHKNQRDSCCANRWTPERHS